VITTPQAKIPKRQAVTNVALCSTSDVISFDQNWHHLYSSFVQILVFDWIAGSSQVISPGKKDRINFGRLINPWHIVDFSSQIFLVQSSLGKSLIYCVHNFYNLGKTGCTLYVIQY